MFVRRMKNYIAVANEVQQAGSVTCSYRDILNDDNAVFRESLSMVPLRHIETQRDRDIEIQEVLEKLTEFQ